MPRDDSSTFGVMPRYEDLREVNVDRRDYCQMA